MYDEQTEKPASRKVALTGPQGTENRLLAYSSFKFLMIRIIPVLTQENHSREIFFKVSTCSNLHSPNEVMKEISSLNSSTEAKDHAENTEYFENFTQSCDSLIVEFSCGKRSLINPSESKFL